MEILTKERDVVRMQARAEQLELSVRDKLSLSSNVRRNAPVIYFVTPTAFRPAQKADLTRLSYTLSHVPNLHWIVIEDSEEISNSVEEILHRSKVKYTHLNTLTNPQMKMKFSDPNWYLPRGVEQRNAALEWIRRQLSGASSGVVYFGDDDNTYDLRLFEEIRNVKTAGIWPVGIVGGLFVETPSLDSEGKVQKFNAIWKTERPFPIDMAAFALHISLILKNPKAAFTYNVARGYQESHFLSSLNLLPSDLQPLAQNCTKAYVWHTRTEKSVLSKSNQQRLAEKMGERKGQNFYYPPDFDYKKHGNLNRYHGTHALRERAAKIGQGILIIRFEMPFNIWCLGCRNHVGMGVRYNAEKKKVGNYYTTPIYEFRMKCHLCDNYFLIRTDPKNFDYELVEGCSRQEKRYDPSEIDQLGAVDRTFNQKLVADAMFKAEHEEQDKAKATTEEGRLEKLEWLQERTRDDFAANSFLRHQFRTEKTSLKEKRAADADLKSRNSLDLLNLLPEDPNDKKVASMLTRYKTVKTFDEKVTEKRDEIESRRIFGHDFPSTSKDSEADVKERLAAQVRQQRDKRINKIFENNPSSPKKSRLSLGIVKKVKVEEKPEDDDVIEVKPDADIARIQKFDDDELEGKKDVKLTTSLVDYGNSSDDSD
ncbi:hypothetical protein WR25_00664 [Diploscapter pachys]|uniref:Galactosylgalactosylxylosylprotein 3-beta-glucuronosyltransferase n=1 Tax=Diploscapter pachys TaxID=2018661 RepID=A0A2A2JIR1_9BILA|nr:hypothetical protein WR25_00664 [Diploscapter pachys]